jgi:hypothetical protein
VITVTIIDLWAKDSGRAADGWDLLGGGLTWAGSPVMEAATTRILYIPLRVGTRLEDVTSYLKRIPVDEIMRSDVVVFRAHRSEAHALYRQQDLLVQWSEGRLMSRPAGILDWYGGEYCLRWPKLEGAPDIHASELIRELRSAELRRMVSLPGAILPPAPDFHYAGPNNRHYKSFVRVGMSLRSVDILDAVVFWLIPHLQGRNLVILDTWTILSLGLHTLSYADRTGIAEPGFRVRHVEALREYGDQHTREIENLLVHLQQDGSFVPRPLLVVSASGSGGMIERLFRLCSDLAITDFHAVSLFTTGSLTVRERHSAFCELEDEFRPMAAEECALCLDNNRSSEAIPIDPSTYLLVVPAESSCRISRDMARPGREFVERYRGIRYLSVHRDFKPGGPHRAVYIDVGQLVDAEPFAQRLSDRVLPLARSVDVILAPDHPAARKLAERVGGLLGIEFITVDDHMILSRPDVLDRLSSSPEILLVDDVAITGSRFRSYRNVLARAGMNAEKLRFLVGVLRPPSTRLGQAIRDAAHDPSRFIAVDEILLPDWSEDYCPWCWEAELYRDLPPATAQNPRIRWRAENLRHTQVGLSQEIFLTWDDSPEHRFVLGTGSIFGEELTDVELFVSVASGIQRLRSEGSLSERHVAPISRYLDPDFTLNRYYEGFIAAAILRATHPRDLRSAKADRALQSKVEEWFTTPSSYRAVAAELLLAIRAGKLPATPAVRDRAWLGPLASETAGILAGEIPVGLPEDNRSAGA